MTRRPYRKPRCIPNNVPSTPFTVHCNVILPPLPRKPRKLVRKGSRACQPYVTRSTRTYQPSNGLTTPCWIRKKRRKYNKQKSECIFSIQSTTRWLKFWYAPNGRHRVQHCERQYSYRATVFGWLFYDLAHMGNCVYATILHLPLCYPFSGRYRLFSSAYVRISFFSLLLLWESLP